MAFLEFEKDLWGPLGAHESHPVTALVAQRSSGVMEAAHRFHWAFFDEKAAIHLDRTLEARRIQNLGAKVTTFREEFLHLSLQTIGGFLVVVLETGGAVRSVDTWLDDELSPRALTREEARARFKGCALVVMCDPERVSACWHKDRVKRPMQLAAQRPSAHEHKEGGRAPPGEAPSAEVLETRALIKAAREALRPENWALRPVSSE